MNRRKHRIPSRPGRLTVMVALMQDGAIPVVVLQLDDQSARLSPDGAEALGAAIIGAATTARLLVDLEQCKTLPGIDAAMVDTISEAIGRSLPGASTQTA